MKTTILSVMMIVSCIAFSQKKNGTIYIEHPAIDVVQQFVKATAAGDKSGMGAYLTSDFKAYNGTTESPNDTGMDKAAFLDNQMLYFNELDYYSIETFPGSYPDAIEYQKDNAEGDVWVQTWDLLKGIHKETGVKIDAASHRLYTLTKDNKIKSIILYKNDGVIDEIQSSFAKRTNGKIYNHHENINTVRKGMYYFEKGDVDKSLSFYADDATFYDINRPYGESRTKAQTKVDWENFLKTYEIVSIEEIGYPDYLEYELNNGRNVLSWWKYNLIRKSDKKKLSIAFHFSNDFDENGKITREMEYYGAELLKE